MNEMSMLGFSIMFTGCVVLLGFVFLLRIIASKIQRRDQDPTRVDAELKSIVDQKNGKFQIVAVHGLGAHYEHTWIRKVKEAGSEKDVHLLRDLLPTTFPTAVIRNFKYNCDWLVNAPVQTSEDIGRRLLDLLEDHKEKKDLPIIFIGHSFGGIVIKQALCIAQHRGQDTLKNTCGIFFLGTPHLGSSTSIFGYYMARMTSLLGSDTRLLLSLEKHSEHLADLMERCQFLQPSERTQSLPITALYEQLPTYILGCVSIGRIVDKGSAICQATKSRGVATNHSGLNKCYGFDDPLYKRIKAEIEAMRQPSNLEKADEQIIRNYKGEDRLKIIRLSSHTLNMSNCYVNLSIVLPKQQNKLPENISRQNELDTSLLSRLNIPESSGDSQISLSQLFEPRKLRNGGTARPQRILIRGVPGVGKTTLCKKIVYDFVNHQQWHDHFDRLLWIPLRKLSTYQKNFDLQTLFSDEYDSFIQDPHEKHDPSIWAALCKHIAGDGSSRTLFLLDGLDEIQPLVSSTDSGDGLHQFLELLLNEPNAIVTSRPSVNLADYQRFDVELETVGFHKPQVEQYVKEVMKEDRDPNQASEILKFLQSRPLIEDLVRIPIQLDALCFAWEDRSQIDPKTMTQLYAAIDESLSNRVISDISHAKSSRSFLEALAFHGLYNRQTVFNERDIRLVWKDLLSFGGLPNTLTKTSPFLRWSDTALRTKACNLYFIHLTFQEYFAAQYIRRHWVTSSALQVIDTRSEVNKSPKKTIPHLEFFRQHKYSPRYDIVWRFLSGLFGLEFPSTTTPNANPDFQSELFHEIQAEPLDLVGFAHQRLVLRCLYETDQDFPLRSGLENQLSRWLEFQYTYRKNRSLGQASLPSLAREMEFPMSILSKYVSKGFDMAKFLLFEIPRQRTLDVEFVNASMAYLSNSEKHGNSWFLPVLNRFPPTSYSELSEESISTLTEQLESRDDSLRRIVMKALIKQEHLPKSIFSKVVHHLLEEIRIECSLYGRGNSVSRLGLTDLPDHMLEALAERLNNKDPDIRGTALLILENQENLPDSILSQVEREFQNSLLTLQPTTFKHLISQQPFPNSLVQGMIEILEEKRYPISKSPIQKAALRVMDVFPDFLDAAIESVVGILESPWKGIQMACIEALRAKPMLLKSAQSIPLGVPHVTDVCTAVRKTKDILSEIPHSIQTAVEAKLNHPELRVQLAAVDTLKYFNPSDTVFKAILHKLEDNDESVRHKASSTLLLLEKLPKSIWVVLVANINHANPLVRAISLETLARLELDNVVLEAIARYLDHSEFVDVQSKVILILFEYPSQSSLAFQAVQRLIKRRIELGEPFDDLLSALEGNHGLPIALVEFLFDLMLKDRKLGDSVMYVLQTQSSLPGHILRAIIEICAFEKSTDRLPSISNGLKYIKAIHRQDLSNDVLQAVAKLLGSECESLYDFACGIFDRQETLETVIQDEITKFLKTSEQRFRETTLDVLYRPILALSTLKEIAKLLEYNGPHVQVKAIKIIGLSNATDEMLEAIATKIDDQNPEVQIAAIEVISESNATDEILQRIARIFRKTYNDNVQTAALKALKKQESVPGFVLNEIAMALVEQGTRFRKFFGFSVVSVIIRNPNWVSIFGENNALALISQVILQHSFDLGCFCFRFANRIYSASDGSEEGYDVGSPDSALAIAMDTALRQARESFNLPKIVDDTPIQ
ncbi:hypothetical protein PFICI_07959 [Pestalotiopsis fici W106-1]|uniref:Protein SERAC1 n=1 Tax=Pestalotiopsis fici (strain W106-1 / CGMCC3.15140) TaxID=1229662 RepID=W3X2X6_PESFW|nr:uncharacterized protein PFICI_07959 [Pestalotiopsis fici W106-1]ETS80430.1 hypothetical protein PFICI_07959 [Pestalotiopsis fici W106-1]